MTAGHDCNGEAACLAVRVFPPARRGDPLDTWGASGRAHSLEEYGVPVPLEQLARWPAFDRWRQPQCRSLELIVVPPVLEVLLEPATHPEPVRRRDRDVATIEQGVDVGA